MRPSLLQIGPSFPWEHQNAHRELLGALSPLYRYSTLPYFMTPLDQSLPRLIHQQAHLDAMPTPAVALSPNLLDTWPKDKNRESLSWWLFANHNSHYIAQNEMDSELTYPFW